MRPASKPGSVWLLLLRLGIALPLLILLIYLFWPMWWWAVTGE